MVAVMVIMGVMAAMAPVFYGLMRATSSSDYRSVANGIAIKATEQMRSIPYYEVGFQPPAFSEPAGCPSFTTDNPPVSLPPVNLDAATPDPVANFSTTQTVSGVTYTIQRCINWINSSIAADTLAYKQTVVTVSWKVNGISSSASQTSALYPGGESNLAGAAAYQSGGEQDFSPDTTTTLVDTAPAAPGDPTLTQSGSVVDVTWSPSAGAPVATTYDIWYTTVADPGDSPISGTAGGQEIVSATSPYPLPVGPGAQYWIQVVAVYGGQTSTPTNTQTITIPSTTTTTTGGSPTTTVVPTTTTTLPCTITGISVTPSGTSTSPVFLQAASTNTSGTLQNPSGQFSVSVNDSGSCGVVTVGYNPSACTLRTSTTATTTASSCSPTSYITMVAGSGGTGTMNGNTPYGTVWSKGTQDFLVYVNSAIYSPMTEAQTYVCVEAGNSGNCK